MARFKKITFYYGGKFKTKFGRIKLKCIVAHLSAMLHNCRLSCREMYFMSSLIEILNHVRQVILYIPQELEILIESFSSGRRGLLFNGKNSLKCCFLFKKISKIMLILQIVEN